MVKRQTAIQEKRRNNNNKRTMGSMAEAGIQLLQTRSKRREENGEKIIKKISESSREREDVQEGVGRSVTIIKNGHRTD